MRDQVRFAALVVALLGVCGVITAQDRDQEADRLHTTSQNAPPAEARIDINHATVDELLKVHDMTRSWAGRIVRFRPYRSKLDLLDRGVVPSEIYDRIKDFIIAHKQKQ